MKKTLAILLLAVANLVFLAHIAIPHHHHGNIACFTSSHCSDAAFSEDSNAEHSHDHPESSLCRVLQDAITAEANSQKLKIEANDYQLLLISVLPQLVQLDDVIDKDVFLLKDNSCQSLFELILVGSQGLRAPPIC